MDRRALFLSFVLSGVVVACSPGSHREKSPAARGGEDEPAEDSRELGDILSSLSMVYVPIEPGSLHSLDVALEEKGYGNVTASDLKRQFIYSDTSFGRAMVAYSTDGGMAPNSLYETMAPSDWLRFALDDESAAGVVLDPERRPVTLEKKDIAAVLDRLAR